VTISILFSGRHAHGYAGYSDRKILKLPKNTTKHRIGIVIVVQCYKMHNTQRNVREYRSRRVERIPDRAHTHFSGGWVGVPREEKNWPYSHCTAAMLCLTRTRTKNTHKSHIIHTHVRFVIDLKDLLSRCLRRDKRYEPYKEIFWRIILKDTRLKCERPLRKAYTQAHSL